MLNSLTNPPRVRPYHRQIPCLGTDHNLKAWLDQDLHSLSIEIGCGAGLHPISWAKQNPKQALIAIERTKNKYSSFQQRLQSHNLRNLYGVNADAEHWLPQNIGENSVDQYFLLFPNPYPKEKQSNKRFHRAPFFEFILSTLKKEGQIHISTNEEWYAEECLNYASNFWNLDLVHFKIKKGKGLFSHRTHFEKKYLERGHSIFDLCFAKKR